MDRDIQRIGIGNSKYAAIGKNDLNLPKPGFSHLIVLRFDLIAWWIRLTLISSL
jgi:hypothetical protein